MSKICNYKNIVNLIEIHYHARITMQLEDVVEKYYFIAYLRQ